MYTYTRTYAAKTVIPYVYLSRRIVIVIIIITTLCRIKRDETIYIYGDAGARVVCTIYGYKRAYAMML